MIGILKNLTHFSSQTKFIKYVKNKDIMTIKNIIKPKYYVNLKYNG